MTISTYLGLSVVPEIIGDTTLTGSVASVSFSSIPSGYGQLYLEWGNIHGDNTGDQNIFLTFNSDSGNNYDNSIRNFGAASSTSNAATYLYIGICGDTDGDVHYSNGKAIIFNRASQEKVFIGIHLFQINGGASANDVIGNHLEGKWRNTADEISTVTITASTGNFVAGSRFILRGAKV